MQATVELLDLQPAAIEHLDRVLLDQTKGQIEFQAARDLLELDFRPCQSILAVEFFQDVPERLAALARRKLGLRTLLLNGPAEMNLVWSLRKAGLSLLTGRAGKAKPVTGIEDAAVRVKDLPAYFAGLESLMASLDLEASYYGHAAAGLLHVRPILDLRSAEDLRKFRQLAGEVSALVRQFKGSLAGEHGVGIARTEFMGDQLGEALLRVMGQIKHSFDPNGLFNPGKIIPDGRFKIDGDLRLQANRGLVPPFMPVLAFAAKDGSFIANLEQCNGCGGCLKQTPTMCPTFIVTGREVMSTRGRANAIRAVLEERGTAGADPLSSAELDAALSNCLACRACATECPSNVNLALLKAELEHARIRRDGLSLRQRLISSVDTLGRLGCLWPWLANHALASPLARALLAKALGLASQRPLPRFARQRFDRWFARHPRPEFASRGRVVPGGDAGRMPASRGRVVLWDDTFARYYEPHIGVAAVAVLEAAGFEVVLAARRKCCGRPAFSQGHLDRAKRLGEHNLALFTDELEGAPILFLEPSCYSMFAQDYRELRIPGADRLAARCFLFEQFIDELLIAEPGALTFSFKNVNVVIHAHCHVKSLLNPAFLPRLAERLPGRNVTFLDSGCCGMAGAFGALESKYALSLEVAEPLVRKLNHQPFGTTIVASGASCRQQITHLVPIRPWHMAEVLAQALAR